MAGFDAEFDARVLPLGGELPGVAEQVFEHRAEQGGVAPGLSPLGDGTLHFALRVALPQVARDVPGQRAQIHGAHSQLRRRHPRKLQQGIDEQSHTGGRRPDPFQVLAAGVIQALVAVFLQRLTEAVDAAQGRAQVVGDGIAEGFQLLVGHLESQLRPLAFGDIASHGVDEPLLHVRGRVPHQPAVGAIPGPVSILEFNDQFAGLQLAHRIQRRLAIVRMNEFQKRPGLEVLRGVAQRSLPAWVQLTKVAVQTHDREQVE